MNSFKSLFGLMVRYGLVGVVAALVHIVVALVFYLLLHVSSFWSHAAGVFAGFITAYIGHFTYSFKNQGQHKQSLPKFAATSFTGMLLQQTGVLVLVNQLGFDYVSQALPVLMVAVTLVTFLLSKYWVFR